MAKYNPYLIPVHCAPKVSEMQQRRNQHTAGRDSPSLRPAVASSLCLPAGSWGGFHLGALPKMSLVRKEQQQCPHREGQQQGQGVKGILKIASK